MVVPVTCRLPCTERRDPGVDVLIPMNELEELNVRTLPESSRQLPVALLKHPPESCMPLAKVEVAVVEVALSTGTLMAVYMVEVPVDTKFAAPCMERRDPALVVPMPTLPSCFTLKSWPFCPTKRVEVATSA